jgi:dATP pyrophosphohydrolase
MRQPIQVAVYCARRTPRGWEFLLLHRLPDNFPIWQGVTGGVEDDESPLDCARREFAEETGLRPVLLQSIDYSHRFPLDDRWRDKYGWEVDWITEHNFIAVVEGRSDPVISPAEHDRFLWCTLDEALDLMYWPENKKALALCREFLESGGADSALAGAFSDSG